MWLKNAVKSNHIDGASIFVFTRPLTATAWLSGNSPATREFAALQPGSAINVAHGLLISGGSAFGLDACAGLLKWQREKGCGVQTIAAVVPICPVACIYDLNHENSKILTPDDIYHASSQAMDFDDSIHGQHGAGKYATVSKIGGLEFQNHPGGMAFVSASGPNGLEVTAFVVCNALGDVVSDAGNLITGPMKNGKQYSGSEMLLAGFGTSHMDFSQQNTSIAAIFTNARLDRNSLIQVCKMSAAGLSRSLKPAMTPFDGDIIFAFSTDEIDFNNRHSVMIIGELASNCLEKAVRKSVTLS